MKKLSQNISLNSENHTRKVTKMETLNKTYRDVILQAVWNEYGILKSGSKILAKKINISHRSVENWFYKKNAPNGEQLIELMIENDAIADTITRLIEDRKQKRQR